MAELKQPSSRAWTRSLPNEHGFWVMLGAAVLSAELRAGATAPAVGLGLVVTCAAVAVASLLHRRIRGSERAQLAASASLSLIALPVEWIGGVPVGNVLAGVAARAAVFVMSALLVRAAFARSARKPALGSAFLQCCALGLLVLTSAVLMLSGHPVEARANAWTLPACLWLVWRRPTAKQLKSLGVALAGVTLGSAVALAL